MAYLLCLRRPRTTLCAMKHRTRLLKRKHLRGISTFRFSDLKIKEAEPQEKNVKPDFRDLRFGKHFSDHMFQVPWSNSEGWGTPFIRPLKEFKLHPGAKVFHYAQEVFEGMKAFRSTSGEINLFRPDLNMRRFIQSAKRADLPTFCGDELLQCIKKLISLDKDWLPVEESCSLYIRPTLIATEPSLGIASSKEALLYVITSPTGSYFRPEVNSVDLLADPNYVRAWTGGAGNVKMGSNYGPTIYVQTQAEKQGLHQVLWLFGDDHRLSEIGAMNVFVFLTDIEGKKTLVTPPLNGTVLPGVIRQSVLELAREWNEFQVQERYITMHEVLNALSNNYLLEIFGTGTACQVCPVSSIQYCGEKFIFPTMKQENPLFCRLLKELDAIQYGQKPHKWAFKIDS